MSSGVFEDDIDSTVVYDVNCSGIERNVLSCSLSYFGEYSEHSASVICQGKTTIVFEFIQSFCEQA